MRIDLFDFQKTALHDLREKLTVARQSASINNPQAISFSAPTGSGKTVIMTALFEAILETPDDQLEWPLDWQPQKDAVILWVSDMPELNEQTRRKIETQSDKVHRAKQLIMIDANFDQERLDSGTIFFVNTQKLATDKLLTRVGDSRRYSFWTTVTNTARAIPDNFFVVIDEAHRGMSNGRATSQARSIMQRFILGHQESGLERVPILIGLSATPKRFNDLLSDTPHTVHKILIPPEDVRKSGLLKDRILIHHPDTITNAELGLLEEATRRWVNLTRFWDDYCHDNTERNVRPILVVQVENASGKKLTGTNLSVALKAIEDACGRRLSDDELAHSFQESTKLEVDNRLIRKIEASRIEENDNISVVFFKTNLSTGWDCPRAEVMMSFRHAQDHTYIAQLIGRMVRTPLARRVERRAELNDVHLFLPHFDSVTVKNVIAGLQNSDDVPPIEAGIGREFVILKRRLGTERIFTSMEELVTYRVNAHRAQSDIRRYLAIARQLTIDGIDDNAWDQAKQATISRIKEQIDGLKASDEFEDKREEISRVELTTIAVENLTGLSEEQEDYIVEVSDLDLDRMFEEAGRKLSNGLHREYWNAHKDRDATEVKFEIIILSRSNSAISSLEKQSQKSFNELFDQHRRKFNKPPEQRRAIYDRLRSSSTTPAEIQWRLQESIDFQRNSKAGKWDKHLYVEDDGVFRADLGTWEEGVVCEELAKSETVAWLRNLDRKSWSLEIPYEQAGKSKPMFPDILIVRMEEDGFIFDVLEPHDPSRSDNIEKARGLAKFAEKHGGLFGRIQLIRKGKSSRDDTEYSRLEINNVTTIEKLRNIDKNSQLDALFDDHA